MVNGRTEGRGIAPHGLAGTRRERSGEGGKGKGSEARE